MTLFSRVALAAMTMILGTVAPMSGVHAQNSAPVPVFTPAIATQNVTSLDSVPEESPDFASLSDAIAAHVQDVTPDEALRCLAGAVYFEARGEPLAGQLAVAEVIINRAKSGRFPADLCGVVTQRGQFGFVRGGRIPDVDEDRGTWRTAVAVARVALSDAWDSEASKALYFNRGRAPAAGVRRVAAIGHHVFYR